jgi:hypothetical protein
MEKERKAVNEEHRLAERFGVAVFIIDPEGRVYTQLEMEEDILTGKKPGEYSVICEKRKPAEGWNENIIRGISEETGISKDKQASILKFDEAIFWETGFVDKVWATVTLIPCDHPGEFMKMVRGSKSTDGVEPVGFLTRDEFEKLDLRPGVRNIIDKYGSLIFNKDEKFSIG